MKRHPGLHALSQHHHFALIEALMARRAAAEPETSRAASLRRLARKFLRFWERAGHIHFREEEEILLPAYARYKEISEDKDIVRMLADHAAIRARILDLRESLEKEGDLGAILLEIGQRLQEHVRLEEDKIFPRMEKTLTEKELNAVGGLLTRLHKKGECEV